MGNTDCEKYMLDALRAIASFGKGEEARKVLRPYMDRRGIKWDNNEDVKTWMQRIAEDAIRYAERNLGQNPPNK